jgi:hypothetical protein
VQQPFQIAQRPIYQKEDLLRSRAYRQFVKSFPCIGCRKRYGIDPMHTGAHGHGIKASDETCLPGCRKCHRKFDANPREFARKHKLDIPALIAHFNGLWAARKPMATGVSSTNGRARSLDCSKQKKRSAA